MDYYLRKTLREINHLSTLDNGNITAISDYVVDAIWTQSHSIGVPHGLGIVRTCTKEDFSCGDEFYYVEVKDIDAFTTFANYMDYTEDVVDVEIKSDIITFFVGEEPEEGMSVEAKAYRRVKREIFWAIEEALDDDDREGRFF